MLSIWIEANTMDKIIFWTDKRLEALSRTSLTLFQGLLLGGVLGEVFGKIDSIWMKSLFVVATVGFLIIGLIFSDKTRKEI